MICLTVLSYRGIQIILHLMAMTLLGRNHPLFTRISPSILRLAVTKVRAEAPPFHLDLPTRRQFLQTTHSPTSLPLLPVWKSHLLPDAASLPPHDVRSPLLPASASASQPAWQKRGSSVLLAASPALWTGNQICSPVPFLLPWPSGFQLMTAFKKKCKELCYNPQECCSKPQDYHRHVKQLCNIHSDQPRDNPRSFALFLFYMCWPGLCIMYAPVQRLW